MKLIVLAGLVTVEKIELAAELAARLTARGQSVVVLDNLSRLPIDPADLHDAAYQRLEAELTESLPAALAVITADVVILAVRETIAPDQLFLLLDELRAQLPSLAIQSVALLDTRTCDCFPNLRVSLEEYADAAVYLPLETDEVLELIS